MNAAGQVTGVRQPAFLITVVRGPDRRRQLTVRQRHVLVGTGAGAGLRLTDPTVSSAHCELTVDEGGLKVRDLGSRNGTFIGDRRVVEVSLRPKDELMLGATVLKLKVLDEFSEETVPNRGGMGRLRGSSLRMRELYSELERAATSDATVLLEGETGTGKELAVDALVQHGPRRDGPLVVVDCARLTGELAESELFGHVQGSFTGATRSSAGAFERAHGGTLFLDEVGEIPLSLQPKLLGVLERRCVQPIGADAPIPIDVRVIAATQHRLERAMNRGGFRADLFYRLAVIHIRVPALREHPEDIPELIAHLLEELPGAAALSPGALAHLYDREYPGNVRELRQALERAVLGLEHAATRAPPPPVDLEVPFRVQKEQLVAGFEREYVARMLEACGGNVSEAARRSGISRVHLHGLVRRLGLSGT